jgi:predicted metalloprotease
VPLVWVNGYCDDRLAGARPAWPPLTVRAPDTERRLLSAAAAIGDDRILHSSRLSGPFGNLIDQFTTPSPHGNAQGRASFVQVGYRDGRQRGIVSCAIVTANLR